MRRKQTVFGSQIERSSFASVQSEWSDKFNVYLSLPFSNIIDFATDESLSNKERETLLKTSVDFTLANKQKDRPIISVEFDGIGFGFNKDGVYIQQKAANHIDPHRKLKLDLKLKACREANYPMFVISYREMKTISTSETLTILDGLLGAVLARQWEQSGGGKKDYDKVKRLAEKMFGRERKEWLEDAGIIAELHAKLRWNPIIRRSAQLFELVVKNRILKDCHSHYLTDYFEADEVAVRVTSTSSRAKRSTTIKLRNTNTNNIDVMEIAESIGKINVFTKLLIDHNIPVPPPESY